MSPPLPLPSSSNASISLGWEDGGSLDGGGRDGVRGREWGKEGRRRRRRLSNRIYERGGGMTALFFTPSTLRPLQHSSSSSSSSKRAIFAQCFAADACGFRCQNPNCETQSMFGVLKTSAVNVAPSVTWMSMKWLRPPPLPLLPVVWLFRGKKKSGMGREEEKKEK